MPVPVNPFERLSIYLLTVISPFLNFTVSTVIVFNNPVGLYSNPDLATFNGVLTNGNIASLKFFKYLTLFA